MSIKLKGSTSGSVSLDVPAAVSGGDVSLTLPNGVGSAGQYLRNSGTAGELEFGDRFTYGTKVASTSGTSIEFTNIPSTAKRITVFLDQVSLTNFDSQSNALVLRLGTGSTPTYKTSGYEQNGVYIDSGASAITVSYDNGFLLNVWGSAPRVANGRMVFTSAVDNKWVVDSAFEMGTYFATNGGIVDLGAALTAVQLTTPGGTDTFDNGQVNMMYEV